MNSFFHESDEPSGCFDTQDSSRAENYPNRVDSAQASCSTSNYVSEVMSSSPNTSAKRKFSKTDASKCECALSPGYPTKVVRKCVRIDMDDFDATESNSNESFDTNAGSAANEERMEEADKEEENESTLCAISSNSDNSDTEVPDLKGPLKDPSTSQPSADEALFSSSDSSTTSQSSESDIFVAGDGSRYELSDEDNNNNYSGNESMFTGDSDDESESYSDDQEDYESSERIPQVLKKTLQNQEFSFPKKIMNRQFHDDFKRLRSIKFGNEVYGSRKMVQRLSLYKKLEQHTNSVNSIFFNATGEILISASDDRRACLWDWAKGKCILHFETGHVANVFQAKFLPFTNDTHMITSGADSQVRMSLLDESGLKSSSQLLKHARTVRKVALQKQVPNTFLTAGEDGVVYSIDIREPSHFSNKILKVVGSRSKPHLPVFLYSIDCNPLKNHEFIVCGNDKDVRLYDSRKISPDKSDPMKSFCPQSLSFNQDPFHRATPSQQLENYMKSVTCAVFNHNGTEIVASYKDNDIYLFDSSTTEEVHHYDGHRNFASIKGVNFYGPHSEYIVSGSDCGYVYLWDKNSEAIVQWMKGDEHIVNCLESHPSFPVLATSGIDSDVKIWMPLGDGEKVVKDSPDFQRVTKKNYSYKYTNASGYSTRAIIVIRGNGLFYDPAFSPTI